MAMSEQQDPFYNNVVASMRPSSDGIDNTSLTTFINLSNDTCVNHPSITGTDSSLNMHTPAEQEGSRSFLSPGSDQSSSVYSIQVSENTSNRSANNLGLMVLHLMSQILIIFLIWV